MLTQEKSPEVERIQHDIANSASHREARNEQKANLGCYTDEPSPTIAPMQAKAMPGT